MGVLMTPLIEWSTFTQVVGSAAGALTGLQFVVMALISDIPMRPGESDAGEAFASPTIVHFVAVLMLAASMAMPWRVMNHLSLGWTLAGLSGLVYTAIVLRRMRRQASYKPVLEDWLFHTILPFTAYAALTVAAIRLDANTRGALFGVAGVALLLLFVGIHNAWDNVLFLVAMKREALLKMRAAASAPPTKQTPDS